MSSYTAFDPADWSGRNDGPGKEHARWNSTVKDISSANPDSPGIALFGFASDEGVRRNGGRQGAGDGPSSLRSALSSLAIHDDGARYDAGTVSVADTDLESGQADVSQRVSDLIAAGHTVFLLGGGHETAWASHRGLHQAAQGARIAIINIDAHFDLRREDRATSGTPFLQIHDLDPDGFNYTVLGISTPNNTRVLFDTADELGVTYLTDEQVSALSAAQITELVDNIARDVDIVHLSIDLDALPASVAPGVSAPAAIGAPLTTALAIARAAAATNKLRLVDVVEINPRFDIDARTARVAARFMSEIASTQISAESPK